MIDEVNNENRDYWMDEFTRAGLMNSLDKCTKIFISDEADIAFTESGLFYGLGKSAAEVNCRCTLFIIEAKDISIIYGHCFSICNDIVRSNVLNLCTLVGTETNCCRKKQAESVSK